MSQPIARTAQLMRHRPAAANGAHSVPWEVSTDLTATASAAELDLPHERDEKAGMTDGVPSERVRQGSRDLKRGVLDTSRAPEADAAYRKLKR